MVDHTSYSSGTLHITTTQNHATNKTFLFWEAIKWTIELGQAQVKLVVIVEA